MDQNRWVTQTKWLTLLEPIQTSSVYMLKYPQARRELRPITSLFMRNLLQSCPFCPAMMHQPCAKWIKNPWVAQTKWPTLLDLCQPFNSVYTDPVGSCKLLCKSPCSWDRTIEAFNWIAVATSGGVSKFAISTARKESSQLCPLWPIAILEQPVQASTWQLQAPLSVFSFLRYNLWSSFSFANVGNKGIWKFISSTKTRQMRQLSLLRPISIL